MALMASMPVIEDLTMKFNRHTLQDNLQNFYTPKWQAKEFALYIQPNYRFPSLDQSNAPFEFKAIGGFATKRNNRNKMQNDRTNSARHSPKRNELKTSKRQTANSDKEIPSKSIVAKSLDFGELSEDEELSCYFSKENELARNRFERKSSSPNFDARTRRQSHNRKRSIEDEDCKTMKRICRPRLNFDKMLLNSRQFDAEDRDSANYFRPISPSEFL